MQPSKFSIYFRRRLAVSGIGFLRVFKKPNVGFALVNPDTSTPLPGIRVPANPLVATRVVATNLLILGVLGARGEPKIPSSVIESEAILMIYRNALRGIKNLAMHGYSALAHCIKRLGGPVPFGLPFPLHQACVIFRINDGVLALGEFDLTVGHIWYSNMGRGCQR